MYLQRETFSAGATNLKGGLKAKITKSGYLWKTTRARDWSYEIRGNGKPNPCSSVILIEEPFLLVLNKVVILSKLVPPSLSFFLSFILWLDICRKKFSVFSWAKISSFKSWVKNSKLIILLASIFLKAIFNEVFCLTLTLFLILCTLTCKFVRLILIVIHYLRTVSHITNNIYCTYIWIFTHKLIQNLLFNKIWPQISFLFVLRQSYLNWIPYRNILIILIWNYNYSEIIHFRVQI